LPKTIFDSSSFSIRSCFQIPEDAMATRFDTIADVYDETRRRLDIETLEGVDAMLSKHGCHNILEIGVGTGRVALPLIERGYEVAGADISIKMMGRAREKGLRNLLLADGARLPFREKSFDAAFMAHVFHLLENPLIVMIEAAKVASVGVFALVRKGGRRWFFGGSDPPENLDEYEKILYEERRARFRKLFEKYNYDPAQLGANWRKEEGIVEDYPPDDLQVVSDVIVTESLEDRLSRFSKGAYSSFTRLPDGLQQELIDEMRSIAQSSRGTANQTRHEVYQLAMWNSDRLAGMSERAAKVTSSPQE
jgi:ubiquinone/menaquinone biosynthesis C-methylase UbiE